MKVSDLIITAIAAFLCGFVVVANEITCYESPWTISIDDRDGVQGYKNVSNATCPKINVIAGGTGTRIYHNVTMPSEQGCDVNVEFAISNYGPKQWTAMYGGICRYYFNQLVEACDINGTGWTYGGKLNITDAFSAPGIVFEVNITGEAIVPSPGAPIPSVSSSLGDPATTSVSATSTFDGGNLSTTASLAPTSSATLTTVTVSSASTSPHSSINPSNAGRGHGLPWPWMRRQQPVLTHSTVACLTGWCEGGAAGETTPTTTAPTATIDSRGSLERRQGSWSGDPNNWPHYVPSSPTDLAGSHCFKMDDAANGTIPFVDDGKGNGIQDGFMAFATVGCVGMIPNNQGIDIPGLGQALYMGDDTWEHDTGGRCFQGWWIMENSKGDNQHIYQLDCAGYFSLLAAACSTDGNTTTGSGWYHVIEGGFQDMYFKMSNQLGTPPSTVPTC